ncbi:helix-turn-helix domain-containing protein [Desulfobacterium sp. N47]|uniref:helix-turn-helix domain-containing protein n=1 Tax=Desulfobacterium sp. N47 TaxID=3115210 RepID=UPI003F49BE87
MGKKQPLKDSVSDISHFDSGYHQLSLTNRTKGCKYSSEQRQQIIESVSELCVKGISKANALKSLKVYRSTYYGRSYKKNETKILTTSLTESERQAVIEKKKSGPQMSHRQISGSLRHDGYWISPSRCYRVLKNISWVWSQTLREAPYFSEKIDDQKQKAHTSG